jgi:DNA-binding transcriptional LysR family regulator
VVSGGLAATGVELHQLQAFVVVGKHLNLTRAADLLHIAQPALSRKLHALEEEVGMPLLRRGSRGVELTPAGQAFLSCAVEILHLCEQAKEAAIVAGRAKVKK